MDSLLSIGALSRATGIPPETLRTWERRYGFPLPERKPSGQRLYPTTLVPHLMRIRWALAEGHRPADVMSLNREDLDRLLRNPGHAGGAEPERPGAAVPGDHIGPLLEAAVTLNRPAILNRMREDWAALGPLRFVEEVTGPFLAAIGSAWEEGALSISAEHLASAAVREFLGEARRPYDREADGPQAVLACLSGERHEGGLLMAALILAVKKWRVAYLGPDTPVEEITSAADTLKPGLVAVSVSAGSAPATTSRHIKSLRDRLPRRVPLWVGGAGAPPARPGVTTLTSLAALHERLEAAS